MVKRSKFIVSECGEFPCPGLCPKWKRCEAGQERAEWMNGKTRLLPIKRAYAKDSERKRILVRGAKRQHPNLDPQTGELVGEKESPIERLVLTPLLGRKQKAYERAPITTAYTRNLSPLLPRTERKEAPRPVKIVLGAVCAFLLFCAVWGVVQGVTEERPVYDIDWEQAERNAWDEYWGD